MNDKCQSIEFMAISNATFDHGVLCLYFQFLTYLQYNPLMISISFAFNTEGKKLYL